MRQIRLMIAAFLFLSFSAQADLILTYTGPNFDSFDFYENGASIPDRYTSADRITGSIVLGAILAPNLSSFSITPISFSFMDGVQTLTNAETYTSGYPRFDFSTDAAGVITDWDIFLRQIYSDSGIWRWRDIASRSQFPIDFGIEYRCSSGTLTGCSFGVPSYRNEARVTTLGTWRYETVPEPGTLALLVIGLFGMGLARRKKKA